MLLCYDKFVVLSSLRMYYTWRDMKKSHTKTTNSKYQPKHGMKSLIYLTDSILYQISYIILNIS